MPFAKNGLEAVHLFCNMFEQRFGVKYLPSFAKDGKLMKAVLAVHGDKLEGLLEKFFADDSDWVKEAGYTIPIFYSRINGYVSQVTQGGSLYGRLKGSLRGGDAALGTQHGGQAIDIEPEGRLHGAVRTDVRPAQVVNSGPIPFGTSLRPSTQEGDETPF